MCLVAEIWNRRRPEPTSRPTSCPTDDVLGALVHHALDPDEAAQVTAHLDTCVPCQQLAIAALRGGIAAPSELAVTASASVTRLLWRTPTGTRIGRYQLGELLGVGGLGAVYEAHDTELDRAVALKVLRPELADEAGLADRLIRESRLMARVDHPSVITVYDAGAAADIVFIAMELIRGTTLTTRLASRGLDRGATLALFERAGRGLAAAHGAGIIHRDFKPDNVLVSHDDDRVVVTDFGTARDCPAYMSPEQLVGQPVDLRADVFAFAVSLWEALFGERPFRGASVSEILVNMRRPPRPPAGAPRVAPRLVATLVRGLAVDPRDRWPDMPALLGELAAIRAQRTRWAFAAAGLVGLVGVSVAAVLAGDRPAPPDDRKLALATLVKAASTAETSHRDDVAARSWIQRVEAAEFDHGDAVHALEYAAYADAAVDRAGRPSQLVMRLAYARGLALVDAHRLDEAGAALRCADELAASSSPRARADTRHGLGLLYEEQGHYLDAIAMFRDALDQLSHAGVEDAGRTIYLQRLAVNLALLGRRSEAQAIVRSAVDVADVLPETHRDRPLAHLRLAEILQDLGSDAEALAEASGAVAMFARTQGARSPRFGEALRTQGDLFTRMGRYAEAEPLLARGCEIIAFAQGDEATSAASCEAAHAAALLGLQRDADALALLDHATPLLVKAHGPAHLEVAEALGARGAARAGLGQTPAAVADLASAVAILAPLPIEPGYLAMAKWQLGRALWPDEPVRARREITQALELFRSANGRWSQRRATAAAWFARHSGEPRRTRDPKTR